MTDLLISFTMNLIEYWIFLLLMQNVCGAHLYLGRKNILLCSGISLASTLASLLLDAVGIPYITLLGMPLAILLSVLLCSCRRTDFFLYIPAFALYFILAFIPERILLILVPSLSAAFVLPDSGLTVTALLSDLILLAFLLLLQRILTKYRTAVHFSLKETLGSIGLVFFAMIDVMLLLNLDRSRMTAGMYYIWVCIFVGMLVFGIGYYLYQLSEARILLYRRITAENEIQYLRLQLTALQDLKENEDNIQKLRHDLSNHLTVIQSLCDEGSYDEVRRYTRQLRSDIALPGSAFLSGSKTADLVLRDKKKRAEELQIDFSFEGSLERLEDMLKPDVCGLLANAYDNAIEACKNLKDPYIRTTAKTTRNYTVIQITNPVTKKVAIRGGRIPTSKKERSAHGYGTRIIREISQKYHGDCVFSCTEQEFRVKITLLTSSCPSPE